MISVDFSLFIQMANFILLIFILNAILYKPIRNILIERKKKIQSYEKGIEALEQDAAESEQTLKAKISEAKSKGIQEKDALKEAGQEEEKRLINEINQKAQADLEAVRAQIAKDVEAAKGKLKAEVKAFSAAIAEKILGRAVS
ncbi:MAG: ATP synthase F0 subunit B [Deltaproteobacteria bacterium]|nr:ATP synthase F0 subunit B [Deltaproteobacteria bacterium]MBW2019680.1 ATP synthase F0 subunit B [Deltaproteobacteria bacterium]MBW2074460.1 ATP synthase F0 subunit B [Deltaproteobacteria bacterium]RLB81678.1 MAG: ATPase [Deltaproteobacteria bacterium]